MFGPELVGTLPQTCQPPPSLVALFNGTHTRTGKRIMQGRAAQLHLLAAHAPTMCVLNREHAGLGGSWLQWYRLRPAMALAWRSLRQCHPLWHQTVGSASRKHLTGAAATTGAPDNAPWQRTPCVCVRFWLQLVPVQQPRTLRLGPLPRQRGVAERYCQSTAAHHWPNRRVLAPVRFASR